MRDAWMLSLLNAGAYYREIHPITGVLDDTEIDFYDLKIEDVQALKYAGANTEVGIIVR